MYLIIFNNFIDFPEQPTYCDLRCTPMRPIAAIPGAKRLSNFEETLQTS